MISEKSMKIKKIKKLQIELIIGIHEPAMVPWGGEGRDPWE